MDTATSVPDGRVREYSKEAADIEYIEDKDIHGEALTPNPVTRTS